MLEKMREIIADQLGIPEGDIQLESSFKDDLDIDSLDLFELVMALEETYNIEIPAEESSKLNTVADVIEFLKEKGIED